ncbi:hypothetical protein SAMN06265348_106354 [Pedobacter westerhofensis]|uniref:CarboxypepD_reg-like domain-containing protein n=1 Tax=Pedobacter westerhofensis TaxID=425512 RepID=A0A521E0F6_9SPHI|nr:hypothetical protein [Pedobacter westerhofensis]SMO76610.1 hypothetical protein SAMN06265348_106354 [Pedobacter westerhofensis]
MIRTALQSLFIPVLLLASTSVVSAQEDFRLNGVIMVKGSTTRVALAEITNKRTKYTVGSNDLGIFQIKALVGDTLLVIKRSFSDVEQVVLSDRDMIIYVDMGNTLNQVNIRGQSKKQELDQLKQDYRDKGSFYQGKPPLLSYIFAPITALYELFGSTPKKARRFGKYYNTELQQTTIDGFFNEALIQKNTELEGKDLENFMLNYRPEYSRSKNWTEYDAVKYIRDSYKQYTDTLRKK